GCEDVAFSLATVLLDGILNASAVASSGDKIGMVDKIDDGVGVVVVVRCRGWRSSKLAAFLRRCDRGSWRQRVEFEELETVPQPRDGASLVDSTCSACSRGVAVGFARVAEGRVAVWRIERGCWGEVIGQAGSVALVEMGRQRVLRHGGDRATSS